MGRIAIILKKSPGVDSASGMRMCRRRRKLNGVKCVCVGAVFVGSCSMTKPKSNVMSVINGLARIKFERFKPRGHVRKKAANSSEAKKTRTVANISVGCFLTQYKPSLECASVVNGSSITVAQNCPSIIRPVVVVLALTGRTKRIDALANVRRTLTRLSQLH